MYGVMDYWDELDVDDPATPDVEREFATLLARDPEARRLARRPASCARTPTLVEGDVVEAVRAMKAGDGPPIMLGAGAELFATLSEAGLIDDYRFLISPTALGKGKSMFGGLKEPLRLRLVATRAFPSGSVLLEYVPA